MKLFLLSAVVLTACGPNQITMKTDLDRLRDKAESYVVAKCLTTECIGAKVATADNIVGDTYHTAKDDIGAEANRDRGYLYDRGIEEMRHGDQDVQQKADANQRSSAENSEAIAAGAASVELQIERILSRLSAIASVDSSQEGLLSWLEAELSSLDSEVEANQSSSADSDAVAAGLFSDLNADIESLETLVASIGAQADSNGEAIEVVEAELASVSATASLAVSEAATANSGVSALQALYDSVAARVSILESLPSKSCKFGSKFKYRGKYYRRLRCGSQSAYVEVMR